jgi:hypothetical protein
MPRSGRANSGVGAAPDDLDRASGGCTAPRAVAGERYCTQFWPVGDRLSAATDHTGPGFRGYLSGIGRCPVRPMQYLPQKLPERSWASTNCRQHRASRSTAQTPAATGRSGALSPIRRGARGPFLVRANPIHDDHLHPATRHTRGVLIRSMSKIAELAALRQRPR